MGNIFTNNSSSLKINKSQHHKVEEVKSITKEDIYKIVHEDLAEQVPKNHIVRASKAYREVFFEHVDSHFGWIIPGLTQVSFYSNKEMLNKSESLDRLKDVEFYAYNDSRLLKEVSEKTGIEYTAIEYILNDYFDTCIYLISKGYQTGIASTFYVRFLGKNHLSRFYPSGLLRDRARELGYRVSIHSLLSNKGES